MDLRSPGIKQKNPPSHFSPFNPAFARSAHNHERTHGSTTGGESDSPATSPQHHGSRGGMSPTSQASTPKNSTPISPHASSADAEKIAVNLPTNANGGYPLPPLPSAATPPPLPPKGVPPPLPPRPNRKEPRSPHMDPVMTQRDTIHSPPFRRGPSSASSSNGGRPPPLVWKGGGWTTVATTTSAAGVGTGPSPMSLNSTPHSARSPQTASTTASMTAPPSSSQPQQNQTTHFSFSPHHVWESQQQQQQQQNPSMANTGPAPPPRPPRQQSDSSNSVFHWDIR